MSRLLRVTVSDETFECLERFLGEHPAGGVQTVDYLAAILLASCMSTYEATVRPPVKLKLVTKKRAIKKAKR